MAIMRFLTGPGQAGNGQAGLGEAARGTARMSNYAELGVQYPARRGVAWPGVAEHGLAGQGKARLTFI